MADVVRRRPWVAVALPIAIVAVAALLRMVDLGHVERIQFDESYYANDANALVERGVEVERPAHPPVGKWVLAAGIAVLGFDPVGWRIGAAVAGTVTVLSTYGAGLLLLRDRWLAAAAAALVALDGLAITTSRIAMLDASLALFASLALLLVLRHRRERGDASARPFLPAGPELWLAGVAFGLAVGTKWAAVPMLGVAVLIVLWGEVGRRRASSRLPRALLHGGIATVLPLVVVPLAVYVASYGGFFANYTESKVYEQRCPALDCEAPPSERVAGLWFHHQDLVRMHRALEQTHPYRSAAASWLLLERPVLSYLERCPRDDGEPCVVPEGKTERIVMVGNPALWWPMLASLPLVLWQIVRRRDRTLALVVGLGAALYLPWLGLGRGYLFYLTPLVPFAALSLVAATRSLPGRSARVTPWLVVGAAVVLFGFLAPIWYGWPLDDAGTDARLLLDSWR